METKGTNNVMLIYAYDTQNNGTELGPGSKERIDAGLKYILESEHNDWMVILGADKDPKRPECPLLKNMMHTYLKDKLYANNIKWQDNQERFHAWSFYGNGQKNVRVLTAAGNAWGSFNETVVALDTLFKVYKGGVGYYYAVSADFHLPRIKLIWLMLGLPLHKTIGTLWKPIWKEKLLEPVKMLKVILLGSLRWIRVGA